MKVQQKQMMSRVFLGMAVFMLFSMDVSSIIFFNGYNKPFVVIGGDSFQSKIVEDYTVKGAGNFLESYSNFLLFLNKVEVAEMSGLDYNEAGMILSNAIEQMSCARDTYIHLKQKVEYMPYNLAVIDELLNFNYDEYQRENKLLLPIFNQVRFYLSRGKIREICGETISRIEKILNIAHIIEARIGNRQLPEISTLWDLNQACSISLLFGQYTAEVFREINKNG